MLLLVACSPGCCAACHVRPLVVSSQGRQGTWNRRVRGCALQVARRNFRVFEGPCTRPARPPEASKAPQDRRRLSFFGGGLR
jgi:hypothetical protein